jgi:hypothetical protein
MPDTGYWRDRPLKSDVFHIALCQALDRNIGGGHQRIGINTFVRAVQAEHRRLPFALPAELILGS